MAFVQQPRRPADGPIVVQRLEGDRVGITVVDNGATFSIGMSEYNASRVLSGLALLLGIRLNAQDSKGIKL